MEHSVSEKDSTSHGQGMRTCTMCGEEKPATLEFFYKDKRVKSGLKSRCKKCTNKVGRQHYQNNPDFYKQYREDNKERTAEYNKQYMKDNKERLAQYYQDHKEHKAKYNKQWRTDNKEHRAEYRRQYNENNREKVRAWNTKRRAAKKGAKTVKTFTRQDVLDKWGTDCHICKNPIDLLDWHMEHVVALSNGGEHSLANVKPSHPKCNFSKGSK